MIVKVSMCRDCICAGHDFCLWTFGEAVEQGLVEGLVAYNKTVESLAAWVELLKAGRTKWSAQRAAILLQSYEELLEDLQHAPLRSLLAEQLES